MKNALVERLLYILLGLVFVAAVILLGLQVTANQHLRDENAGLRRDLGAVDDTTKSVNKSLSCILVFFTIKDRANYRISDLTTCTIVNTETGESQVLPIQLPSGQDSATPNTTIVTVQPAAAPQPIATPVQPSSNPEPSPQPQPEPTTLQRILNTPVLEGTTDFTCDAISLLCR